MPAITGTHVGGENTPRDWEWRQWLDAVTDFEMKCYFAIIPTAMSITHFPFSAFIKFGASASQLVSAHRVSRQHLPWLAATATADICHQTNLRPCSAADFEALFTAAMQP